MSDPRTDEELLAAVDGEPEAFGVFYRRHVRPLLGYFVRRTRRRRAGGRPVRRDLRGRARRRSAASTPRAARRSRGCTASPVACSGTPPAGASVEDRARRRLGMAPLELTDAALERIEAEAGEVATSALDALPADQREAVRARILDERDYADIARTTRTSEAVVRKRVSRGLAGLRARVKENGT